MLTENIKLQTKSYAEFTCDVCDSTDVIETREGYTCKECGIVLEVQKLEYYRPYDDDILQHAPLGTTQIGFLRERLRNSKSYRLEMLNKLQSIKSNEKSILEEAKIEILRIFNCLDLPESYNGLVFDKFKKIRAALRPGTKYRSPEKLVPISIYFTLKLNNTPIKEPELLEVSKISRKDFNAFKLQIYNFIPQYAERNRKEYILQKVLELSEHFQLGLAFFYQSKKILYKFWESIKNTSDDVIAGLVASISVLCAFKEKVSVSSICNKLGIRMSTIQFQVKKRIFERLKISGFCTLVKSSDLLKKFMQKMGLLDPKVMDDVDKGSIEITPEIIEIKLGNAVQIFNRTNNIEYYFYILRNNNGYPLFVSLKLFNPSLTFENQFINGLKNRRKINNHEKKLFDIELLKFWNSGKDPPYLVE